MTSFALRYSRLSSIHCFPRLLAHIILGQYHSCLVVALVIARRCRHATFLKTVARIDRRATADAIPRPVTIACVNSLVHENVSRLVSNAISP